MHATVLLYFLSSDKYKIKNTISLFKENKCNFGKTGYEKNAVVRYNSITRTDTYSDASSTEAKKGT